MSTHRLSLGTYRQSIDHTGPPQLLHEERGNRLRAPNTHRAPSTAPDGGALLVSGGRDTTVRFWNLSSGREVLQRTTGMPVKALDVSPWADGNCLLAAGGQGGLAVLEVRPELFEL